MVMAQLEGPDAFVSLVRAGQLIGRCPSTLRTQAARGKLRTVKISRDHLTTRRWLHDYLLGAERRDTGRFLPYPEGYVDTGTPKPPTHSKN